MQARIELRENADADADQGLTVVNGMNDLNVYERERVLEVALHDEVWQVTVEGRDEEGTLVIEHEPLGTAGKMPYDNLYVLEDGRVAEAMLNQPRYFDTFAALVANGR